MNTLILWLAMSQAVAGNTIVIGMEGHTGAFSADEENLGMKLVIQHVNDSGGIHGRKLAEKSYPRDRDNLVPRTVENVRRLVEKDGAFLLYNFGGPSALAVGRYAMENKVPYLFPHTALLTVDGNRHVFTSFPRYPGESAVMLRYLVENRGVRRVAVIHAPNVYGDLFVDLTNDQAEEIGYAAVGNQPLERFPSEAVDEMRALQELDPDVLIMALYPEGAKKVVEAKAHLDWDIDLVSSGPLTDEQYLNIGGGQAEGTLGFCYYPDPNISDEPGVLKYRELMDKYYPGRELNRYSLYGYVFGSLIIEGLRRAGPDLTQDNFLDAMESIHNWDSGGIMPPVSFSTGNHHAQRAGFICELKEGRFQALSEWIEP